MRKKIVSNSQCTVNNNKNAKHDDKHSTIFQCGILSSETDRGTEIDMGLRVVFQHNVEGPCLRIWRGWG